MEAFVNGQFDKVELIYNQFKNAATQIVQTEQYLCPDCKLLRIQIQTKFEGLIYHKF